MTATELIVNLLVTSRIELRDMKVALDNMTISRDLFRRSMHERVKDLGETHEKLRAMTEERDAIRDKALDGINRMLEVVSGVER